MSDPDERPTFTTPDGTEHVIPEHPDCQDGWAGEDLDGRPKPCPICRGHLRRRRSDEDGLSGWTPSRRNPHHEASS